MKEHNNATKKFVKTLDKHLKKIFKKINFEVKNLITDKLETKYTFDQDIKFENYRFPDNLSDQALIEQALIKLEQKEPELIRHYSACKWILELINGGHAFNEYAELEELFKILNTDEEQQIEVIGSLLKMSAYSFALCAQRINDAKKNSDNKIDKNFYLENLDSEFALVSDKFGKDVAKQCKTNLENMDIEQRINEDIAIYKIIDSYIDDNGIFIGTNDTDLLKDALAHTPIRMTEAQRNMIINYIANKYRREEENKYQEKIHPFQENVMELNLVDKKERYEASQIIKGLLINGEPRKYITGEEFVELTNALITLNYSDTQIAHIQKSIIKNNNRITLEREQFALNNALNTFLTIEELEIFTEAEDLINGLEHCENLIFNAIKSDFCFIKDELINLQNNNSEDILELIKIALYEIRDNLINYKYSDYRFARNLTKKDGVNE